MSQVDSKQESTDEQVKLIDSAIAVSTSKEDASTEKLQSAKSAAVEGISKPMESKGQSKLSLGSLRGLISRVTKRNRTEPAKPEYKEPKQERESSVDNTPECKLQPELNKEASKNTMLTDKEDGETQSQGNKEDAVGAEGVATEASPDERDREGQAAVCQEGGKSEDGSKDSKKVKDNAKQAVRKFDGAEAKPKGGGIRVSAMQKAIDLAKQATEADNAEKFEEAMRLYVHAIDYFLHAVKHEVKGAKAVESVKARCEAYIDRADQLRKHLNEGSKKVQKSVNTSLTRPTFTASSSRNKEGAMSSTRKTALEKAILVEKPNVKWDDIAGIRIVKEALKEKVVLPVKFPHLFKGKRAALISRGILLYGPSGIGKSHLAKAVASAVNATFFSISTSDLVGKWLEESQHLVKQLFDSARQNKPAIIFIDEVDSLYRSDSQHHATHQIKTEFLAQTKAERDNEGVLWMGATNIPWSLDAAVRKRFQTRIYIPLPDEETRRQMFKIHIGNTAHSLTPRDWQSLAGKTDGYSGADIEVVVREALMMPLRKVQAGTHFKKASGPSPTEPTVHCDDLFTPCGPNDPGAIQMSWMDVPGDKLLEPKVTIGDFLKSLQNTRPTVKADDLRRFENFTLDFGVEG